jgi:hypothetical protein
VTQGWVVNGVRRHAEPLGDNDPPQLAREGFALGPAESEIWAADQTGKLRTGLARSRLGTFSQKCREAAPFIEFQPNTLIWDGLAKNVAGDRTRESWGRGPQACESSIWRVLSNALIQKRNEIRRVCDTCKCTVGRIINSRPLNPRSVFITKRT